MKLNGIDLESYAERANEATFVLSGTTLQDALALDGQTLAITDAKGEDYKVFAGYSVASVGLQDAFVSLRAVRALDDRTEDAIAALDANVATAQETAEAAMEAAQAAGTEPAVKAASALYVNAATTLTNSDVADVRDLVDDFTRGGEYAKGAIRRYEGKYWRMAQDIDSTTSTTYQPGDGTESLYTLIDLAPDGIRVWHMPSDATNSFALGEKAHYPDADGAIYVSKREGNASEPTKDEWWELDQTEAE